MDLFGGERGKQISLKKMDGLEISQDWDPIILGKFKNVKKDGLWKRARQTVLSDCQSLPLFCEDANIGIPGKA